MGRYSIHTVELAAVDAVEKVAHVPPDEFGVREQGTEFKRA